MKEAPISPSRIASHGSESEKPYQRACLRDLGRTWPSGRSSRSALAGGGAGSARGIDGGARPKIRAAKEEVRRATQEAASTGTCEDRQHPRRGELTPQRNAVDPGTWNLERMVRALAGTILPRGRRHQFILRPFSEKYF